MPVSLLPEDALKSFGVQPGLKRVVASEWMVHQFPPNKEGKQSDPFFGLHIGYLPIDEAGKATGDAQDDYVRVGPKFEEPLEKCKFAPAAAPGKPEALRVGAKGPFIEAIGDQTGLYESSKVMLYLTELFRCGFSREKFKEAQMSVGLLVGTEGEIFEKVSPNSDGFKDTKIHVFKSIRKFGYEAGVNGASGGSQGGSQGGSVGGGTQTTSASSGDAPGVALAILKGIAAKEPYGTLTVTDLVKKVLPTAAKLNPRPSQADRDAAKVLLANPDFYERDDVQQVAVLDGTDVTFV